MLLERMLSQIRYYWKRGHERAESGLAAGVRQWLLP